MFDSLSPETLRLVWYSLLGVLLVGYAILDGFDLGVGIIHPFVAKTDDERRVVMNSVGPLWDGNEVWLVTFGGALFAMFPEAYATILSGLYLPFVFLLFALIFRAVSLEFRSKVISTWWRSLWDWAFFGSSLGATLIYGAAVGLVLQGFPLDERGVSTASLGALLSPYAFLMSLLAVTTFTLHGSLFLEMKCSGELQGRVQYIMWRCFGLFLVTYLFGTIGTVALQEHILENFRLYPLLWVVPVLHILVVANIPRCIFKRQFGYAFIMSCMNIVCLVCLLGEHLFPYLIRPVAEGRGMTLYEASSSPATLRLGLIIVLIGMPMVLAYTAIIYWTFRGKVELDQHSY